MPKGHITNFQTLAGLTASSCTTADLDDGSTMPPWGRLMFFIFSDIDDDGSLKRFGVDRMASIELAALASESLIAEGPQLAIEIQWACSKATGEADVAGTKLCRNK